MSETRERPQWHIVSAIAAWLVPGLGHWLLGQRRRAVILCVSIGFLWISGFFIGGINIFDRKAHPVWFAGQMLLAPSLVAEYGHRKLDGINGGPARPDSDHIPYVPSYGHIHEQGVLYTALAGMLNLLAIMDVLYQDPTARARRAAEKRRGGQPSAVEQTGSEIATGGGMTSGGGGGGVA